MHTLTYILFLLDLHVYKGSHIRIYMTIQQQNSMCRLPKLYMCVSGVDVSSLFAYWFRHPYKSKLKTDGFDNDNFNLILTLNIESPY